ncbi:hypothetical protein [Saccharopolyspora hattusasensis]|uniref:hypothetical protein n=1 Tax=Saccharopolyspora hattusasensis TaxID=1128679 RepID=UPI003D954F44
MHSTGTWDELDKDPVQAFIIEIDAVGVDTLLHKVWRRRDIDDAHWERLLQIAEGTNPMGSSTVLAWQDHDDTWHPLVDIEPSKLAKLTHAN